MIFLLFAASFLALCTLGMIDMAIDVTKRHGLGYALGEWGGALIMLMLTVIVLWVAAYGTA